MVLPSLVTDSLPLPASLASPGMTVILCFFIRKLTPSDSCLRHGAAARHDLGDVELEIVGAEAELVQPVHQVPDFAESAAAPWSGCSPSSGRCRPCGRARPPRSSGPAGRSGWRRHSRPGRRPPRSRQMSISHRAHSLPVGLRMPAAGQDRIDNADTGEFRLISSIEAGSSMNCFKVCRNLAPVPPSTTR